ncbi:hypothetical protein [Sphingomonas sp. LHG3443-2]|uniref:hypothetical protein n=1 Tax=Sphingomonas sp. LHG3443-2 TaxID=2804639 RepID=UPI003CEEF8BE
MLLYHFTAANRLDSIMAEGLTIGDVPVDGPTAPGQNAVWLTSSKEGGEHGLGEPREMTDVERENIRKWKGIVPPAGSRWDDKREVRIAVKVASGDRSLRRFLPWARRRFSPE